MTKDEALKLTLEALGEIEWSNNSQWQSDRAKVAITAIKEALAQPEQFDEFEPDTEREQYSTCSETLRLEGRAYPRTCKKCGLGPCIGKPVAQPEQEPVARVIDNGTPEGATEWIPFANRIEPLKTGDLLYTHAEERNFCPRCGKRTADLTTIHTCTPPQENT